MRWTYLGHAMWLVEARGLRILCDPLLAPTHHCGVFEVVPHREIDVAALRPDFLLVSHRHPDHFDVASLDALARHDPDTVVVTPDALVERTATALGFTTVKRVAPSTKVELDGVTLVTTASVDPREWGVVVAADGAAAWNQVDTVFDGPARVIAIRDQALAAAGARRIDLAAVRWQPMLEIAAQLGAPTRFPMAAYDRVLHEIAAIDAHALVPAAAGGSHCVPFDWLDRVVFPVSDLRVIADLRARCPAAQVFAPQVGGVWDVAPGAVAFDPAGGRGLVDVVDASDRRRFRPLDVPPLRDPNPEGHDVPSMRADVVAWIERQLPEALARASKTWSPARPLSFVLEVVWPEHAEAWTICVANGDARAVRGDDDEWDAINQVAGSLLWQVIAGRRGWGDVLLAGALRGRTRTYAIDRDRVRALPVAELFVYYALEYDRSHERAVEWEVAQALARRRGSRTQ
jgi:hypothetical protein